MTKTKIGGAEEGEGMLQCVYLYLSFIFPSSLFCSPPTNTVHQVLQKNDMIRVSIFRDHKNHTNQAQQFSTLAEMYSFLTST